MSSRARWIVVGAVVLVSIAAAVAYIAFQTPTRTYVFRPGFHTILGPNQPRPGDRIECRVDGKTYMLAVPPQFESARTEQLQLTWFAHNGTLEVRCGEP
jgi:hypothetical protein